MRETSTRIYHKWCPPIGRYELTSGYSVCGVIDYNRTRIAKQRTFSNVLGSATRKREVHVAEFGQRINRGDS